MTAASRRALLGLACLAAAVAEPAEAMPWCLRAQAAPGLRCTPSTAPVMATSRPSYGPWRRMSEAGFAAHFHFTYAGVDGSEEPLFQLQGIGPARTAEEWLVAKRRGVFFFDSADGRDPSEGGTLTPPVTISWRGKEGREAELEGTLHFNARSLTLRRGRRRTPPPPRPVVFSDPFEDVGIDLDGDGVVCSLSGPGECCDPLTASSSEEVTRCNECESIGNRRWDVELDVGCDASTTPCASDGPLRDEPWPPDRSEWGEFVREHDADGEAPPTTSRRFAHEPFHDVPVSVLRRARADASAVTTGWDEHPSGRATPSVEGLVFNEGSVVVGRGVVVAGWVLSGDHVETERGGAVLGTTAFLGASFPPPAWDFEGLCPDE